MSNATDKKYWKTLGEFSDDNALIKQKQNEFEEGVTDDFEPNQLNKISRRKFFAAMTAATALTATACSDYRDKGEIVPYNKRPEGLLPGVPNFYASNVNGVSVLVKTREGRPINIEGNPEHPIYKGKVDATTISSILNLYGPERLKEPIKKGRQTTWEIADNEIIQKLDEVSKTGKEIAVFSQRLNSPAAMGILNKFKAKYPTSNFYFYESIGCSSKVNSASKNYNVNALPLIDWSKVKIALAVESDFLSREENSIYNTEGFSSRRDIMKSNDFIRLYSVEGAMSLTGANADYRITLKPDLHLEFLLALLNEISLKRNFSKVSISNENKSLISKYSLNDFIKQNKLDSVKVFYLVKDLISNAGSSIVLAGDSLDENTNSAVNLLNEILGNSAVYSSASRVFAEDLIDENIFDKLILDMKSEKIGAFINFDSDPVYHFSFKKNFPSALKKVGLKISLVSEENDTSELCDFVLPIHHDLENWNLFQKYSNVIDLQQPVIEPIFRTRQKENILLTWINGTKFYSEKVYRDFIKNYFSMNVYPKANSAMNQENFWFSSLHDGFAEIQTDNKNPAFTQVKIEVPKHQSGKVVCQLEKSYFIGDGKYANNGWLQEIPHPISKVTWDNYASVSPSFAKQYSVEMGDLILVKSSGGEAELPVVIQPGISENTIVTEIGYGRKVIGEVGNNVGSNVFSLMDSDDNFVFEVEVKKTGKTYDLASTQEHHAIDDTRLKDIHKKRNIIREGTLDKYKKDHHFLHENEHNLIGITREHKYEGVKWAMAIDLNKCTSCGTCVSACNVENNIPVVGKDQVSRGREMHWIRIDRYYSGDAENPEISNQPMLCQHCDNAPCENVCPVNATNHSPDGLNQMAYNRCVGTRYCANNCPYKVRRFNFYNFRDNFSDAYYENELTSMLNNPEVTVRSRGVMEKCTFCVQRIMDGRSEAIKEGKEWNGQNMKTACQSACPAEAIVFGNVNDKNSEIYKYREHDLAYHVLEDLYVKPNVTYLAKLRNTITEES